jgi:peroxiredoxin
MSAALRSVGRLEVLSSTPAAPSGRAPCIHARLRRLATKSGEKSGLAPGAGTGRELPMQRHLCPRSVTLARTLLLGVIGLVLMAGPSYGQLGQKVPPIRLKDTNGQDHALAQYAGKITVIEFWSFKCPVSLANLDRMLVIQGKYGGNDVVVLAIASNKNESPAEVARNAANLRLPYPVLIDADGIVADRLGATRAPSIFILDRSGILRYRGAPDNNRAPGEGGRVAYAEDAIDALLAGRPVTHPETKESGCTIRRNSY